jgi:hypothetical protein
MQRTATVAICAYIADTKSENYVVEPTYVDPFSPV